jgi:hypothetical protein
MKVNINMTVNVDKAIVKEFMEALGVTDTPHQFVRAFIEECGFEGLADQCSEMIGKDIFTYNF